MTRSAEDYTVKQVDGRAFAGDITALHRWCFGKTAPMFEPTEGYWWIAYAPNGEPAAFAGLVPSQSEIKAGYLVRAGVLAAHRGRGLQKRLIRVRETKARRLGWNWLRTDTTDNIPSANNLIGAGFQLFEPEVRWSFEHSLYWRKRLLKSKKRAR